MLLPPKSDPRKWTLARQVGINYAITKAMPSLSGRNGPFDLDLIFAPDGIECFDDAWQRRVEVEGFPVCHPDDIIASKAAANRTRDRESLLRLRSFREYWLRQRRRG